MPHCPLDDPQCTIARQTRPVCPMGYTKCDFSISQFSKAELVEKLEQWNNSSLLSAVDNLSDDPELASAVEQIRSNIGTILAEEEPAHS